MEQEEYKRANSATNSPGFDGRLVFFEVGIKKHLDGWGEAVQRGNLNAQFISLKAYHILSAPYIKESFNNIILKQFKEINQILSTKNEQVRQSAAHKLNIVAYDLFNFSRHLLLPQDMEDHEDIDWESMRE